MCGVFGAVFVHGQEQINVQAALLEISHRGPDRQGTWRDDDAVLGHTRLAVIDLSDAASQPMVNDDGSISVVFNGEIYNHHELRDELESVGHRFRSRSDTEVIVRGYERWGAAVVERLDGMFALAIWDKHRGRLVLARDRAGKKPLFYAEWNGGLVFASGISAIHAAGVQPDINPSALHYYLAFGYVSAPETLHAGIRQLEPASRLILDRGAKPRLESFWRASFGTNTFQGSYDEAKARVRALVVRAVERRLESDVPLGAFLSGGIDSTIIVGVMARVLGRKVKTFSIGFSGDARFDETAFARIAADRFQTDHTVFTLEPSSFQLIERLVRHHDGPFGDVSAIPCWVVSELARQHVTVALTGDGGDELFCGYERFLAAEYAERVPLQLRSQISRMIGALPGAPAEKSLLTKAKRFLSAWTLPLADRMARWNSFFFDPRDILRADFLESLDVPIDAPLQWQRSVFNSARGELVLSRVLEHNFRTYLPYDLLVKADRTSMAHGLETRSPFLDTQLIEFAATLPPSFLRYGMRTKRVLKDAFADILPESILRRGKMGFGVPLGTWFRAGLRAPLHDYLGPAALSFRYLDATKVARLLREHDAGVADHGQKLWALLTLEVWLRSRAGASVVRQREVAA
jgi:asparagine synthase (glutamine-hydrolysing)